LAIVRQRRVLVQPLPQRRNVVTLFVHTYHIFHGNIIPRRVPLDILHGKEIGRDGPNLFDVFKRVAKYSGGKKFIQDLT